MYDPPQIGMFGDDQDIHWHEPYGADDPTYWRRERWEGGGRLDLPPDAELHTGQDFWIGFDDNSQWWDKETNQWQGTDGAYYLDHPEDYSQCADDDIPLVARIDGRYWIAHGHHRLMADRRLGRPTTVWHKDFGTTQERSD